MMALQMRLSLLTQFDSGQSWIFICLDPTFIYQLLDSKILGDSSLQISLLRSCAVKFSYLSDTSAI
jgi:hypothetical protein